MMEEDENVFAIKEGDLEPPLEIDISGSKGDLTDVLSWRVIGSQNGAVVFTNNDADFVVGATPQQGTVTHEWVDGQTDIVGGMDIEVKAVWPGSRIQTFPPDKFSRVWVFATLE